MNSELRSNTLAQIVRQASGGLWMVAKGYIPSAAETANYSHFRPGMVEGQAEDDRLAEMRKRFKAWQPIARPEDHSDELEHHPSFAKNNWISGAVAKPTKLPDLPKNLGSRIRLLRQRFGWSIRKLALKAKLAHVSLIAIESGQSSPTIETTTSITRALGVPLAYLVGGLEE